jgi:hypothetical protein
MELISKEWRDASQKISKLIAKSWLPGEEELRNRFLCEPKRVLAENGIDIPEGVNVVTDPRSFDCSIVADEQQGMSEKLLFKLSYPPRPAEVTDEQLRHWVEGKVEYPAAYIPLSCC